MLQQYDCQWLLSQENGCIRCKDSACDWKTRSSRISQSRIFGISRVLTLGETLNNGKMSSTMISDNGYLHDRSTYESVILPFRRTDASLLDLMIEIDEEPKFFSIQYGLTEILSGIQNGLNNVTLYAEVATELYLVNNLAVSCADFSNSNSIHL